MLVRSQPPEHSAGRDVPNENGLVATGGGEGVVVSRDCHIEHPLVVRGVALDWRTLRCRRRGAIWWYVAVDAVRIPEPDHTVITTGEAVLAVAVEARYVDRTLVPCENGRAPCRGLARHVREFLL